LRTQAAPVGFVACSPGWSAAGRRDGHRGAGSGTLDRGELLHSLGRHGRAHSRLALRRPGGPSAGRRPQRGADPSSGTFRRASREPAWSRARPCVPCRPGPVTRWASTGRAAGTIPAVGVPSGRDLTPVPGQGSSNNCRAFSPDGQLLGLRRRRPHHPALGQRDRNGLRTLTGHAGQVWSVGLRRRGAHSGLVDSDRTVSSGTWARARRCAV